MYFVYTDEIHTLFNFFTNIIPLYTDGFHFGPWFVKFNNSFVEFVKMTNLLFYHSQFLSLKLLQLLKNEGDNHQGGATSTSGVVMVV